MRTRFDLPDDLFRHAKALSSFRGISLKTFPTRTVEHELESADLYLRPNHVSFPLVSSDYPGSVVVSSDQIARILESEEGSVSP